VDIVFDTSSIIAVIANEPEKAEIIARTRNRNLISPASVHWEIGNAFSAMLKRKRINLAMAQESVEVYRKIPIQFIGIDILKALELAAKLDIYAYDAYILQAALDQECDLLALDRGLIHSAKQVGVNVLEIAR
jgi:predicted nucleic acid-binding protein